MLQVIFKITVIINNWELFVFFILDNLWIIIIASWDNSISVSDSPFHLPTQLFQCSNFSTSESFPHSESEKKNLIESFQVQNCNCWGRCSVWKYRWLNSLTDTFQDENPLKKKSCQMRGKLFFKAEIFNFVLLGKISWDSPLELCKMWRFSYMHFYIPFS